MCNKNKLFLFNFLLCRSENLVLCWLSVKTKECSKISSDLIRKFADVFVTSCDVSCSILKKYSALLAVSKSFTQLHLPGKWASDVEEMVKKSAKLRRCLVIRFRGFRRS